MTNYSTKEEKIQINYEELLKEIKEIEGIDLKKTSDIVNINIELTVFTNEILKQIKTILNKYGLEQTQNYDIYMNSASKTIYFISNEVKGKTTLLLNFS